jgi:LysM repeat protein
MRKSFLSRALVVLLVAILMGFAVVPGASASSDAAPAAQSTVHVVRAGQTLFSIARIYGVDAYAIARANRITNMNRIYVGQRLVIPAGGTVPPPAVTFHTVRRGETLTTIAWRYGTTVARLMALNGLRNANFIYVGQVLRVTGGTTPPPPPPPPPPAGTWLGTYYNNRNLSGAPALERRDANIDFNWGFGSPAPQVFADNFSARWTRTFYMPGGTYRLTVVSDDGVRVWIDGVPIIDDWTIRPRKTIVQDYVISTGNHTFTVEYFEAEGLAEIFVTSRKLN